MQAKGKEKRLPFGALRKNEPPEIDMTDFRKGDQKINSENAKRFPFRPSDIFSGRKKPMIRHRAQARLEKQRRKMLPIGEQMNHFRSSNPDTESKAFHGYHNLQSRILHFILHEEGVVGSST